MIEVLGPRENVNDETVIVKLVRAPTGSNVKKGDLIADLETSKTAIAVDAPEDGEISHTLREGLELAVGAPLFVIRPSLAQPGAQGQVSPQKPDEVAVGTPAARFSKAARAAAHELGVDLNRFRQGWISSTEVRRAAGVESSHTIPPDTPRGDALVRLTAEHVSTRFSKRKQAETRNLESGRHHSTSSTIGIDVEVPGPRVVEPPYLFHRSISDLLVFEASRLMPRYPELNAAYLDSAHWARYERIHFGWSFDSGSNLKVLSILDTDRRGLTDIQAEVGRLLEIYESSSTIPSELLTTSTVTLTDLSPTQASFVLPLLNGRQSLILGVVCRSATTFGLYATFDHRISEGLQVTRFLAELRERIIPYFRAASTTAAQSCAICEKSMREEIALGNRGLIHMTLPSGAEANVCRSCFDGGI
jgi:pyruvate/2-oxoglutarate dehydrogenase complex dihydrolipoamide acyltransferase (E2) component